MLIMEAKQPSPDTRRRIFRIQKLAAMPEVVWRLLSALSDEEIRAERLARIIESDPAMTSKVLSLANSAFYGLSRRITTIRHAVVIIGLRELKILAIGTGLSETFPSHRNVSRDSVRELWRHCLAVSWLAEDLAKTAGLSTANDLMVAGLLHDLGKLLLISHMEEECLALQALMEQGVPYYRAEERLGLQHTVLGAWLAMRWGLPDIHVSVIRDHHAPQTTDPHYRAVAAVSLADRIAKSLGFGAADRARPLDPAPAMTALGLNMNHITELSKRAEAQLGDFLDTWFEILERRP